MHLAPPALLIATLTLTACATRMNPMNWFGDSRSAPVEQVAAPQEVNPLIPADREGLFSSMRAQTEVYLGTPVDQVSDLTIERVPGGAILRATGIAAFDGAFDVRLIPENEDEEPNADGVLVYRLEAVQPQRARRMSTRQRTFTVARRLSDNELSAARAIRVEGARNTQTTARR